MDVPSVTSTWPIAAATVQADEGRLKQAFDRCGCALHRYLAVRSGGDRHLADDLMQQLWVKASSNGSEHVPEAELEFWLRGIARNLIRAHWRKARNRPDTVPSIDAEAAAALSKRLVSEELPAEALERRELADQLLLAVSTLPAADQEVIVGRYFQGCSHAELAGRLGVSERAVEGRLYRARRSLQQTLERLGATENAVE